MLTSNLPVAQGSDSLYRIIELLNLTSQQLVIICDRENKVIGVVADGDIRRSIIANQDLSLPVDSIMNVDPILAPEGMSTAEVLNLMVLNKVNQVPCVHEDGKLVGLHNINDLFNTPKIETPIVFMAGGRGSRLGELTHNTPKPLLPLKGVPILEHSLKRAKAEGFVNFIISVGYLADQIVDHFGDGSKFNVSIEYLHEDIPLGTAGSLAYLRDRFKAPIIVMNSDLVTSVSLKSLLNFHTGQNSELTICVRDYLFEIPFGVIEVHAGEVLAFNEKPLDKRLISVGIYALNPSILNFFPLTPAPLDMPEIIELSKAQGTKVMAFPILEDWKDIGRPADYLQAQKEI